MSNLDQREYDIGKIISQKKDLAANGPIVSDDLMPENWQDGDMAISKTHFYMIYRDKETGLSVKTIAKKNKHIRIKGRFKTIKAAQKWIKKQHKKRVDQDES